MGEQRQPTPSFSKWGNNDNQHLHSTNGGTTTTNTFIQQMGEQRQPTPSFNKWGNNEVQHFHLTNELNNKVQIDNP
jgi:hypothetical protein